MGPSLNFEAQFSHFDMSNTHNNKQYTLAKVRQQLGQLTFSLRDRDERCPAGNTGVNDGHNRAYHIIVDVNRVSESLRQGLETL